MQAGVVVEGSLQMDGGIGRAGDRNHPHPGIEQGFRHTPADIAGDARHQCAAAGQTSGCAHGAGLNRNSVMRSIRTWGCSSASR